MCPVQQLLSAVLGYLGAALTKTDGAKTYTAAAGLVALAIYLLTQGEYDKAAQTVLMALGYFGLRTATGGVDERVGNVERQQAVIAQQLPTGGEPPKAG